jgi:hypothetical protein
MRIRAITGFTRLFPLKPSFKTRHGLTMLATGLTCAALAFQARAQSASGATSDEALPPPVVAPVLFSYATLARQETTQQICWQVLVPERDVLIREHNAKPWLLRNLTPLVGAAMGGVVGGLLLKHHATAVVAKRWMLPVVGAGAAGGYLVGPGGVTGFVLGGGISDYALRGALGRKLGKGKVPVTVGVALGGAIAGKKLWEMVFPPDVPPAPAADPEGDVDVEVFVRDQVCGASLQTAYSQSLYRVGYRFNGEELVAELPYDPGEALLLTSTGNITGPARVRLD